MSICPVPGCPDEAPARGVFCVDHALRLPRRYHGLVYRTKFACERESDPERREHLAAQLHGYVNATIRTMGWEAGHGA